MADLAGVLNEIPGASGVGLPSATAAKTYAIPDTFVIAIEDIVSEAAIRRYNHISCRRRCHPLEGVARECHRAGRLT